MDNITDIFDSEIQGSADEADALDQEIAASAVMLQKLAEAEGVDIDALPPQDVADLLVKISGLQEERQLPTPVITDHDHTTKEAHMETLTHADVALELSKIAQAEQVDLTEISTDDYTEAFDKLAADMQDPEYFERQKEAAEEDAKAYDTGVKIAMGFIETVNGYFEDGEKEAGAGKWIGDKAQAAGKKVIDMAGQTRRMDGSIQNMTRKAMKAEGGNLGDAAKAGLKRRRQLEQGAAAGVAATTAAGVGGTALGYRSATKGRDKESAAEVEELAMKIARQTLIDGGINPDTGDELDADEVKFAAAESLAVEMLTENGWL